MSKLPIYALIRTHNRPQLFNRCIASAIAAKVIPIVCYDTDESKEYIPDDLISIRATNQSGSKYFYNLHCNDLLKKVSKMPEGYFFFLDDDDFVHRRTSVEAIRPYLQEHRALICQFLRGDRPKPSLRQIKSGQIASGSIGMPCIFMHTKYALQFTMSDESNADYIYIHNVLNTIPSIFVPKYVVMSPKRSHGA